MKANEFVKEFGWGAAKYKADELKIFKGLGGELSIEDAHLMRLVESWELVREHGSIERAKYYAQSPYTAPEVSERLNQAIADVESCQ